MKILMKICIILVIIAFVIHLISAIIFDNKMEYKEISYKSKKISSSMDGKKFVFFSDFHEYPIEKLKQVVREINNQSVDAVLIGGDIAEDKYYTTLSLEIIKNINAPMGFYGVEGNHDDAIYLKREMDRLDMIMLENEGREIGENFYLAGAEDLWTRKTDIKKAIMGAKEEDFVLLLSHNPDAAVKCDLSGVDLTLSGHTHGGEVVLFGKFSPTLLATSRYGHRFRTGWCKSDADTDIYIGNGIGKHGPLRVFCRPQVILLTLESDG